MARPDTYPESASRREQRPAGPQKHWRTSAGLKQSANREVIPSSKITFNSPDKFYKFDHEHAGINLIPLGHELRAAPTRLKGSEIERAIRRNSTLYHP